MSWLDNLEKSLQVLLDESGLEYDAPGFIKTMALATGGLSVLAFLLFYFSVGHVFGYAAAVVVLVLVPLLVLAFLLTTANKRDAQIEEMLPSFLSMMASNIRSGVTYDRALLLSTRKEFGPLAKEIDRAAKETLVGKPLTEALMGMARRTRSEMFAKTMRLIVEGTNAGGNLAEMLEVTANDIRQTSSLKKDITATILIYRLFIFIAAAIGAPLLYALTGFLIEVFTSIRGESLPNIKTPSSLPLITGGEMISSELFFWFAIIAIGIVTFFAALAGGVISKGKESEGLQDLGYSFIISYGIFFSVRFLFAAVVGQVFLI